MPAQSATSKSSDRGPAPPPPARRLRRRRGESERLLALHRASVVLAAQTDPDLVLEKVLAAAGQLLGADSGSFYRWDPEARLLRCLRNWRVPVVDTTPDQQPGEGLAGLAFLRMAPLIVNDYPGWEQAMASGLRAGLRAGLAVPLARGGRPLGVLLMRSYDDVVRFTAEDARLLGLFGDQAAIAIENAELHGAALRRGEELAALLRAGRTVMAGLDLQATLERIVREAAQIAGVPMARILLVDHERRLVRAGAVVGGSVPPGATAPFEASHSGRVAMTGEPLFVADVRDGPPDLLTARDREDGVVGYLGLPVTVRDEVVGVLTLLTTEPRRYRTEELTYLASFADQAAIALDNARLYAAVRQELAERRHAEVALAEAQRIAHLGSWEYDPNSGAVWWSDEVFRIYGHPPQAFVPTYDAFLDCVHPEDQERVHAAVQAALYEAVDYALEHRVVHPDGAVRVVQRQAEVVRDEGGKPLALVGTVHDITERKALEERLVYQAYHDPLTDLPNRALLVDRLRQALARAGRHGGANAVLFLDLDRFKVINDSLGHELGDQLLIAVAARLRRCIRAGDTAARLGGDEFTILLEDVADVGEAVEVAERIIEALRTPFRLGDQELFVTTSIGIVLSTSGQDRPEDLLRDADIAMYRAKAEGKARYAVFDPAMNARMVEQLELERDLWRAVEREEFRVYYQPNVELATGRIVAVEALVRWEHPRRGLVSPGEFIPLAEETGLILPLGAEVLAQACRQARVWQARPTGRPPLVVAVNLSARQFQHPSLVADIAAVLDETGIDPRTLHLEITERVALGDTDVTLGVLHALKGLGVRLVLDDFGTGYSSLGYLQRFPFDIVKLDRSFVGGSGDGGRALAVVSAITSLAHALGMVVTAEGIETAAQLAWARRAACDQGQGYYFAPPLPAEELAELLDDGAPAPARLPVHLPARTA